MPSENNMMDMHLVITSSAPKCHGTGTNQVNVAKQKPVEYNLEHKRKWNILSVSIHLTQLHCTNMRFL